MEAEKIRTQILAAVEEFNASLEADERLPGELDTPLVGDEGRLDSVGLVGLIVLVEEKVEDALGRTITLADERAFSQERSPFRTIGSLAEYVGQLLADGQGE